MTGEIKVEQNDSVVTITISRPSKLNTVTLDMLNDFSDKVSKFTNDSSIGAIIFTGEGEKAFTAGFDLEMITALEGLEHFGFFKKLEDIIRIIRQARHCITIAAVNGYAIGFGAMVAAACDFRFFAENGAYRLPEIDLRVFPGGGAASNLIHLVGPARAKDILLTGRTVDADECLRIGLANRIFPPSDLLPQTLAFIEELLKKDRLILLRTKSLVDAMTGRTVGGADETESTYLDEWLRESE
ncbi:MAG: enoyl-CoA hydratase/isomerase family protein [Candidatus Thorarchaeota archaeon]|nr:enoyl-CoA hydratase/isomerase family protein [Candidatus Thorarchaeota archaeon]MCK5239517.1 enoyl-CoA hydratase/isomerase family protein [Candidatus Thorarchaeota archaeon]